MSYTHYTHTIRAERWACDPWAPRHAISQAMRRRTWSSTKMIKKFGLVAGLVGGVGLGFALRAAMTQNDGALN